ncbi:hypothetical protein K440DRAFT_406500 [Wilcoxina mikolae CBS 423.85]|nr:hypothetical protein K440DRAFT_406500 [Wilcoxina mikolae CBS 423.85]
MDRNLCVHLVQTSAIIATVFCRFCDSKAGYRVQALSQIFGPKIRSSNVSYNGPTLVIFMPAIRPKASPFVRSLASSQVNSIAQED